MTLHLRRRHLQRHLPWLPDGDGQQLHFFEQLGRLRRRRHLRRQQRPVRRQLHFFEQLGRPRRRRHLRVRDGRKQHLLGQLRWPRGRRYRLLGLRCDSATGFQAGFSADKVTDGRLNDGFPPSYWLARAGTADAFTVDLGSQKLLDRLGLQNTRNRDDNDRGTRDFHVSASADGVSFTPLLQGQLNDIRGLSLNNFPIQVFALAPFTARYVKFEVVNWYGLGGGLNEIFVSGGDPIVASQTGIVVSPVAPSALAVTGLLSPVTAGAAASVTVTARDPFGNVATGYRGTVHFTSSDAEASLPSDYTFTADDNGSKTFSVTLRSAGSHSISATSMGDLISTGRPVSATGSQAGFSVDRLTDGRLNDTGSTGDLSYWLTRDLTPDVFTVDLYAQYLLRRVELQNTRNHNAHDRGTKDFRVSVSAEGIFFSSVVQGQLNNVWNSGANIPIEGFALAPVTARFVRFEVLNWDGLGGGLNEILVYGDLNGSQTSIVVNAATTTTAVTTSGTPAVHGDDVTLTATISAATGTPGGSVQFQIDDVNFGSPVTLTAGSATSAAIASLTATTHTVTALYSGDGTFSGSSGSSSQTVTPRPIIVTADATSKVYGAAEPALTYQLTSGSLANGDTFAGALTRVAGEDVRSWPSTATTL